MLRAIARFSGRRYRLVFALSLLLLVGAVAAISRITFDTDVMNLLPPEEPAFVNFRQTMEDFGSFDNLLVGLALPPDAVTEPYQDFAEELAGRLAEMPEIAGLDYRIEEPEELLRELFPGAPFFLDEAGQKELEARLSTAGIEGRVAELRRQLSTPQAIGLRSLLKIDPLGLSEIMLRQVESGRGSLEVDWTSGFYLSRDRRMLLLLVRPSERPQNIDFDRRLVTGVEERFKAVLGNWDEISGGEQPAPELVLGGAYLTALDDAELIQSDMVSNTASSVVGVLLLFLVAFRRPSALVYALVPLAFGLVLTFGFAGLALGELSNATSGVAALLIGLAIDFVIVSYGRYVEERKRGVDPVSALAAMSGSSGRAVVICAVTTAATFFAFLLTDFPGLRQMGILTGTGILFCLVSVLFLLPALLAFGEDHHRKRQTVPTLYLHGFGADRLIDASLRHPRLVVWASLGFTLLAAFFVPRIGFEESMNAMRPEGNRGLTGTAEVAKHFGAGFDFTMLVISGERVEDVLTLTGKATEGAEKLVAEGVLEGYQAVTSILPPPERQAATLAWLAAGRGGALDIGRITADFQRALADQGMRAEPFADGLALLARALGRETPIGVTEVGASTEGKKFLDQALRQVDGRWKTVVRLFPPDNLWRREAPPQVLALAEQLGPDVVPVGSNVVNQRVREIVRADAFLAATAGLLLVALLIWADFRSLRDVAFCLLPLLVGIFWMLGLMAALGLKANFMNIFVSTMIIGIGVDYGVHVIHRYREIEREGGVELGAGLAETGKAVVAAALSTIVGFGSLSLSHYPGLRTTGYVAILGALATATVAITLVPALLELSSKRAAGEPDRR